MDIQEALVHWPATLEGCGVDIDKSSGNKYAFDPVVLTVKKAFPPSTETRYDHQGNEIPKRLGLKFEGDTTKDGEYTGVIWNYSGAWDNDTKTRAHYIGDIFTEGQQVRAALTVRAGDTRNFYDIAFASAVTPAAQPPQQQEAGGAPEDGSKAAPELASTLTLDQRIAKSQAWNGLTAMLAAHGNPGNKALGDDVLPEMWSQWWDGFIALKAGRVPFVQCPHTETLGVAPPEGGFKAGDPTETCQTCGEGVAPYSHQPEHESGMAPHEPGDTWREGDEDVVII